MNCVQLPTTSCSYSSHLPDLLLRACPDNCHLNTPPPLPTFPPIFRKRKSGFCPCLDFPPSWHWRKMRKSESETPSFPPFPSFTLGRFSVRREKVGDGAKRGIFGRRRSFLLRAYCTGTGGEGKGEGISASLPFCRPPTFYSEGTKKVSPIFYCPRSSHR